MKAFFFFSLFISTSCFALAPAPTLKKVSTLGFVSNFEDHSGSILLSRMPSDISFKDLNQGEVEKIEDAIELKKEYGKMFGFNNWTLIGKKYLEREAEKILLLEGHFRDDHNKLISFIEVYWADKKTSNQFLITSEKQSLKMDSYQEYLVK